MSAPIDTIPLFVRAGSIIPLGSAVLSGQAPQYEKGKSTLTRFHWDDAQHQLRHEGAQPWTAVDTKIVQIIGR